MSLALAYGVISCTSLPSKSLYRLTGTTDFLIRGFDEYFEEICCIEWADKIEDILPKKHAFITLKYLGQNKREIVYEV